MTGEIEPVGPALPSVRPRIVRRGRDQDGSSRRDDAHEERDEDAAEGEDDGGIEHVDVRV